MIHLFLCHVLQICGSGGLCDMASFEVMCKPVTSVILYDTEHNPVQTFKTSYEVSNLPEGIKTATMTYILPGFLP